MTVGKGFYWVQLMCLTVCGQCVKTTSVIAILHVIVYCTGRMGRVRPSSYLRAGFGAKVLTPSRHREQRTGMFGFAYRPETTADGGLSLQLSVSRSLEILY